MSDGSRPTLQREQELGRQGYRHVAGVDEAGRGALAGPVVAAAVIVPPDAELAGVWRQVDDSKRLKAAQRADLAVQIRSAALAWAVGSVSPARIDAGGIVPATRLAMQEAIRQLVPRPDYLLIDWVALPQTDLPQEHPAKADRRFVSVAAASILAKVHRDSVMVERAHLFPAYHFASNKGYGSAAHLSALQAYGPSPIHRCTFAPVAACLPGARG